MSNLVIILFEGRYTADEALLRIAKMNDNWDVDIDEFIVVTRDADGKMRLKNSDSLAATGLSAAAQLGR